MISNKKSGTLECCAPSNIALVKYWGKYGTQFPKNPSISFTLNNSVTKMKICYEKINGGESKHSFLFSGQKKEIFEKKILAHLKSVETNLLFLKDYNLSIDSENTFPHSAGIASSASSMASLSFGICILEKFLETENTSDIDLESIKKKASFLSRLGSGSACRSLYGGVVSWGESETISSTNEYAFNVSGLDEIFDDYQDSILIVDSKEKSVSSRAGHSLMENHPFRSIRFKNASSNLEKIILAMKNLDLSTFGEIVEREALELHGLMMNSNPSFILMKPNTLIMIEKIREFRKNTNIPAYFTLDAGPNIHLLYPKKYSAKVLKFIEDDLLEFCESRKCLHDFVGSGPSYNLL